jgi:hypothetical protein
MKHGVRDIYLLWQCLFVQEESNTHTQTLQPSEEEWRLDISGCCSEDLSSRGHLSLGAIVPISAGTHDRDGGQLRESSYFSIYTIESATWCKTPTEKQEGSLILRLYFPGTLGHMLGIKVISADAFPVWHLGCGKHLLLIYIQTEGWQGS